MATRGTYNFYKTQEQFEEGVPTTTIYKHWDNYPQNSIPQIDRFVHSEFSTSLNTQEPEVMASNFLHFLKLEEGVDTTIKTIPTYEKEDYNYHFITQYRNSGYHLVIYYTTYSSDEPVDVII